MMETVARGIRALFCIGLALGSLLAAEAVRTPAGMVVSDDPDATAAGIEILRQGGNAVDATVAVAFALAVTHPAAGNLGGGGFMLIRMKSREVAFADYRETAPAQARPDMYLDTRGELIAGRSTVGWKSAAIPGTVAGMGLVHRRYGRLKWARVLAPAVRLAEQGFLVSERLAASLQNEENAALLGQFPESKRIFLRNGNYYRAGERFRQPELAQTLRRIARHGAAEFYRGRTARTLAEEMRRAGGVITLDDLANYRAKWRDPLRAKYGELELLLAPPPSSGGVAVIEAMNILAPYALAGSGWTADNIHLVAEVLRRIFADRARYLADSDFAPVPLTSLLSPERAAHWRESFDRKHATPSQALVVPEIKAGRQDTISPGLSVLLPLQRERSTTHFSVVDAQGNAVANTYTINETYGSGATVPRLGFLLNNTMDDFTTKPGAPSVLFGLMQSDANRIEPGKRPLSSMMPAIVLRNGALWLVLGSPGGPKIISVLLNTFLARTQLRLTLADAIEHPRFHHQWLPDEIVVERGGFAPEILEGLRARGHTVRELKPWGSVNAIEIDSQTGERIGVSDPRRGGRALGY